MPEKFADHNMESLMKAKANASKVDAVFLLIEHFISEKLQIQQRDKDREQGRKRKYSSKIAGNPTLVSVFTAEWREAVIRFAEKFPIDLLIREYNRYYCNKMIDRSTSVDRNQNYYRVFDLPAEALEEIFFRLPLHDLLASRSVCCDWDSIYSSRYFQGKYTSTEHCIVINNNNLDFWVFSVISKSWFLLKVPCDWDNLGLRTLGIRASCDGLFLVARSDLTLYVVNPLTSQFKILPDIYLHTRTGVKFLSSLIVHGTAEMEAINSNEGLYVICFFGNFPGHGDDCVYLARYTSWTGLWSIKRLCIFSPFDRMPPICSRNFPSPLWNYSNRGRISCFSATCGYFHCFTNGPLNVSENARYAFVLRLCTDVNVPTTIELEYRSGETCYNSVALPTVLPLLSDPNNSEVVWVGRMKRYDNGSCQIYGRLPIVCHGDIGLWKFNQSTLQWSAIDIITAVSMENMIKSSEGTDFIVVGDGVDNIWLMLRGSQSMVHYNLGTREWVMETGCPGGGYMDANFHWKAVFKILKFDAQVSYQV